jgi:hypothetical protein
MHRSRLLAPLLTVGAVLAVAAPALAAWNLGSSGAQGFAGATTIQPPVAATPSSTSSTATVNWTAPVSGAAPTGYTVLRTAPSSATVCTNVATLTCTDTGLSPSTQYTYTVKSLRGAWSSSVLTTTVTTTSTTPIAFNVTTTAGSPQAAGSSFNMTITARVTGPATDTGYTGAHNITFTGPGLSPLGNVPSYNGSAAAGVPVTQSVTFTSGVATFPVILYKAETVVIAVSDGNAARNASSGSITVAAAAQSKLVWVTSSAGTTVAPCVAAKEVVGNGGSRNYFVAANDAYGNLSAGAVSVTVAKQSGGGNAPSPTSLTIGAGSSVTSASTLLQLPSGSPADTVYRATGGVLTLSDCSIGKN